MNFPHENIIVKSDLDENDVPPSPATFVLAKQFVGIWVQYNPAKTYYRDALWEADPIFQQHLRSLLIDAGWVEEEFVIPAPHERCPYVGSCGKQCDMTNTGHHARHMLSHLPEGVGYFAICPACKTTVRRTDMYARHRQSCGVYPKSVEPPAVFRYAYEQNIFLR
jgi:hypothetical protein